MTLETAEFGQTLRAWRERLAPEAAGLSTDAGRRARGLRREELARLAGVSPDYVNRLEQGRFTTPSAQVVSALGRALQLTGAELEHLSRLAGLSVNADEEVSDELSPGLKRMLGRLGDVAVAVFAADWRMIWWSAGWAALLGDPSEVPPAMRNFARATFPVTDSVFHVSRWPVTSVQSATKEVEVVSDLRRATGRFPDSPRLAAIVGDLLGGSARFAELWSTGGVGVHRADRKVVDHPMAGSITVDCDVLTDAEHEQKVVMLTTEAGSEDERRLRLALHASPSESPPFVDGR